MLARLAMTAAFLCLSGCYSLSQYSTSEKVANASIVEIDRYEGETWIKSPLVWIQPWSRNHKAMLRTLITENGSRTNQLYVIYEFVEWAFLDRAADGDGNVFKTTVISRDIDAYGVSEHVAVELSDGYLNEAAEIGLDIQVKGSRGEAIIKLPPHYVDGFLAKVATVQRKDSESPLAVVRR